MCIRKIFGRCENVRYCITVRTDCWHAVDFHRSKRTVTVDEKERYDGLKERLLEFLQRHITPFSQCFPFGYPKGLFKSAIGLLSHVRRILFIET